MFSLFYRVLVCLLCCFTSIVFADDSRSIHIEWGYTPPSEPAVTGFRLYQEGTFVCEEAGANVSAMDCSVTLVSDPTNFTLTATFADGTESPHSAPFAFYTDQSSASASQASSVVELAPVITTRTGVSTGYAPLSVSFDASESYALSAGSLTSFSWDFGDGTSGEGVRVAHVYTSEGTFAPELTVCDSLGYCSTAETGPVMVSESVLTSDTLSKSASSEVIGSEVAGGAATGELSSTYALVELHLEVGTVLLTHSWQRVSFADPYTEPVVVAGPPSFHESDSCVISIANVTSQGFDIRLAEWEYQDGIHEAEKVSYMVLEKGRALLEDGTTVEAGTFIGTGSESLQSVPFLSSFATTPVVLTSVASFETGGVSTVRAVPNSSGFSYRLQGQEQLGSSTEMQEQVDYIAWEPGQGELGETRYAAVSSAATLTDAWKIVTFDDPFLQTPALFAAIQSNNESDTAALRYKRVNKEKMQIALEEEQSLDKEITHTGEQIAYLAFAATGPVRLATFNWQYDQEKEGGILGYRVFANDEEVCETYDVSARSMSCPLIESEQTIHFALTTIEEEEVSGSASNTITYQEPASMRLATFSWEFDTAAEEEIEGFKVLADGVPLCTTSNPSARMLTCTIAQPTTTTTFTVVAIEPEAGLTAASNGIIYSP